jgi:hypothetical protein
LPADIPASLGVAANQTATAVVVCFTLGHALRFAIEQHASGCWVDAQHCSAADNFVNGIIGRIATPES